MRSLVFAAVTLSFVSLARAAGTPPAGPAFCNGADGSLSSCPCAPGDFDTGCDIPIPSMFGGGTTGGVLLSSVAQTVGTANRATMQAEGFQQFGVPPVILFRSPSQEITPVVFGDGIRCVGLTSLVRVDRTIAVQGSATLTFGHGSMAGPGTFYYQAYFRSTPASFCDPSVAFSVSSGQALIW